MDAAQSAAARSGNALVAAEALPVDLNTNASLRVTGGSNGSDTTRPTLGEGELRQQGNAEPLPDHREHRRSLWV